MDHDGLYIAIYIGRWIDGNGPVSQRKYALNMV